MLDLAIHLIAALLAGLPWVLPLFFFSGCACCPTVNCPGCQTGTNLPTATVVVTGITGVATPCLSGETDCTTLDGTYVLARTSNTILCSWSDSTLFTFCLTDLLIDQYYFVGYAVSVTTGIVRLQTNSGFASAITWESASLGSSPLNCSTLGTVAVAYVSNSLQCDASASSADVTFT